MTHTRRLSAVPFPAATLYVNCTPVTFAGQAAGLHSYAEGGEAAFTPGTHLPSLGGKEPWSVFPARVQTPRWGDANYRRFSCFSTHGSPLSRGIPSLHGLRVLKSTRDKQYKHAEAPCKLTSMSCSRSRNRRPSPLAFTHVFHS